MNFEAACHACSIGDLPALRQALQHLRLVNGLALEDATEPPPATAATALAAAERSSRPLPTPLAPATTVGTHESMPPPPRRLALRPPQVAELFRRALARGYTNLVAELLRHVEVAHSRASWENLALTEIDSQWCPPSFANVRVLDLSRNRLTSLPTAVLRALPQLHTLDVSHNALTHLPSDRLWFAREWPFLTVLRLAHNHLTSLPAYVAALPKLTVLDAAHNNLNRLPANWSNAKALVEVVLDNNVLAELPLALLQAASLQVVRAAHNQLASIPPAAEWRCNRLRHLDVGGNSLHDVGAALAGLGAVCPTLTSITLAGGALAEPLGLGALHRLRSLHLAECTGVGPRGLGDLPTGICSLRLPPVVTQDWPPPFVDQASARLQLNYLRRLESSGETPNDLCLVPVVGQALHGKTSLVCALARMPAMPPQCSRLEPAQVCWSHKTTAKSARKLTFVTWDMHLEAYEIAQATVLPGIPAVYVVVCTLEEGVATLDSADRHLRAIKAISPTACAVLVGTHLDLASARSASDDAASDTDPVGDFTTAAHARFSGPAYPPLAGVFAITLNVRSPAVQELRDCIHAAALTLVAVDDSGAFALQQRIPKVYRSVLEVILTANASRDRGAGHPTLPFITLPELQGLCLGASVTARCTQADFDGALRLAEHLGLCSTWIPAESTQPLTPSSTPRPAGAPTWDDSATLASSAVATAAAAAPAAAGVPGAATAFPVVCVSLPYACAVAAEALAAPALPGASLATMDRLALEAQLEDLLEGEGPALLIMSLLRRSHIIVPQDSSRLLVPLRLPATAPSHFPAFLRQLPAQHKVVRRYLLADHIPSAAWLVLQGRLLNQAVATGAWRTAQNERGRASRNTGIFARRKQTSSALPSPSPQSQSHPSMPIPPSSTHEPSFVSVAADPAVAQRYSSDVTNSQTSSAGDACRGAARDRDQAYGQSHSVRGHAGHAGHAHGSRGRLDSDDSGRYSPVRGGLTGDALPSPDHIAAFVEPCSPPRDPRPAVPPEQDLGGFGGPTSLSHAAAGRAVREGSTAKPPARSHMPMLQPPPLPRPQGAASPAAPRLTLPSNALAARGPVGTGWRPTPGIAGFEPPPRPDFGAAAAAHAHAHASPTAYPTGNDSFVAHGSGSGPQAPPSSVATRPPLSPSASASASSDSFSVQAGFHAVQSPSRLQRASPAVSISNVRRASFDFMPLTVMENPLRQLRQAITAFVVCARDTHELSQLPPAVALGAEEACRFEIWGSGLALGLSDTCGILVQLVEEEQHHFVEMCVVVPNVTSEDEHAALVRTAAPPFGALGSAGGSFDESATDEGDVPQSPSVDLRSPTTTTVGDSGSVSASGSGKGAARLSTPTAATTVLLGHLLSALSDTLQHSVQPFPGLAASAVLRVAPAFQGPATDGSEHTAVDSMTPLRDLEVTLDAQDVAAAGAASSRLRSASGSAATVTQSGMSNPGMINEAGSSSGELPATSAVRAGLVAVQSSSSLSALQQGSARTGSATRGSLRDVTAGGSSGGYATRKRLGSAMRNFEVETVAPDLLPLPNQRVTNKEAVVRTSPTLATAAFSPLALAASLPMHARPGRATALASFETEVFGGDVTSRVSGVAQRPAAARLGGNGGARLKLLPTADGECRLLYLSRSAMRGDLATLKGVKHAALVNMCYSSIGSVHEVRFPSSPFGTLHDVAVKGCDFKLALKWPVVYGMCTDLAAGLLYLQSSTSLSLNGFDERDVLVHSLTSSSRTAGARVRLSIAGLCRGHEQARPRPETLQESMMADVEALGHVMATVIQSLQLGRRYLGAWRDLAAGGLLAPVHVDVNHLMPGHLGLAALVSAATRTEAWQRPTIVEIMETLALPITRQLRHSIALPKLASVRGAIAIGTEGDAWLCCSNQIVSVNTGSIRAEPKVLAGWHTEGKPLAEVAVGEQVWISNDNRLVLEYAAEANARGRCTNQRELADSVLAMIYSRVHDVIILALANGNILLFDATQCLDDEDEADADSGGGRSGALSPVAGFEDATEGLIMTLNISEKPSDPVACLALVRVDKEDDWLWCGTASRLVALDLERTLEDPESSPVLRAWRVDRAKRHPNYEGQNLRSATLTPSMQSHTSPIPIPSGRAFQPQTSRSHKQRMQPHTAKTLEMNSYAPSAWKGLNAEQARASKLPGSFGRRATTVDLGAVGHGCEGLVFALVPVYDGVVSAVRRDSYLCVWDTIDLGVCLQYIDVAGYVPLADRRLLRSRYVTSLAFSLENNVLWAGTKSGHLVSFPVAKQLSLDLGAVPATPTPTQKKETRVTFAAVVAGGPKGGAEDFASRGILRGGGGGSGMSGGLPSGDASGFGREGSSTPARARLGSMASTSSSGSERAVEGATFSGYVRQSAASTFETGIGPVRLLHVARDADRREVVLVAGDSEEDQPSYPGRGLPQGLAPTKATAHAAANSSMLEDGAGGTRASLGLATPRKAGAGAGSAVSEEGSTAPQQSPVSRNAMLRTPRGAYVAASPASAYSPQYALQRTVSGGPGALASSSVVSALTAARSGWGTTALTQTARATSAALAALGRQIGHLQVWEAGLL